MQRIKIGVLVVILGVRLTATGYAEVFSTQISAGVSPGPVAPGAEFDSSIFSMFLDPAELNWIAWNERSELLETHPSRPGELLLGKPSLGVDDFIRLTITNPESNSFTLDIDKNAITGTSFGQQAVIFGTVDDAPSVLRENDATGQITIFDEAGSHNSIFTTAGVYEFKFSFRNEFASLAGNSDSWLLLDIPAASTPAPREQEVVFSRQISPGVNPGPVSPGEEFDKGSISLFVDPAKVNWIGWNKFPELLTTHTSRPGEQLLGNGSLGVDDFIRLTVTNPDGDSLTVDIDKNAISGTSFGQQAVIFGTEDSSPGVLRENDNTGQVTIFDEAGSHNSVFTAAGVYEFDFSFRNEFTTLAGNSDSWLLVGVPKLVPEPSSFSMALLVLVVTTAMRKPMLQSLLHKMENVR